MAQTVKLIQVFKMADYAVMQRKNGEYVAGWCPRIDLGETCRDPETYDIGIKFNMYWGQGHYFTELDEALIFAAEKEVEACRRELDDLERELAGMKNRKLMGLHQS